MNLYDKSSLILVPGAVKDGKVYSQRPENGDGDFTFSRSTAATRVNADGLIEKETRNLLLQSNTFNVSTKWGNANSTDTSGQSGYDGSNDAWKITSTSTSNAFLRQIISFSGVNTISVYAKAGTSNFLLTSTEGGGNTWFNLSAGTIGTDASISSNIEDMGSGWYRCSVVWNASITGVRLYVCDADNSAAVTSGNFIYIQDAQAEQGLVARDYIETTTAAVYGGITDNVPRLDYTDSSCPALLLEPQRSNLLSQSEYLGGEFALDNVSLDYNYGTSPEGVSNSALLTQTGSSASNSLYEFGLPTTDGSYTYSFFFKAGTSTNCRMYVATGIAEDFNPQTITAGYSGGANNILFEDYGDGWWRASATKTLSGASTNRFGIYPDRNNAGRNVEIWGFQVEAGSYATSYIPTYGTSVTRNGDVCTNAGNDQVINSEEGVLYVELSSNSITTFKNMSINSNGSNRINFFIYNSVVTANFDVGGVTQASISYTIPSVTSFNKFAFSYKLNEFKLFVNGTQRGSTDTSGIVPPINTFNKFSFNDSFANNFYGKTKQVLYFPTALTDEELEALTTL
jgi:hypothetical protein